jgi:hypothetical protein
MKTIISIIIATALLFSTNCKAQDDVNTGLLKGKERIRAAKIGLITNRLNLSEEQAKSFWTVFNEFENKRGEIRKSIRQITIESRNLTSSDERILAGLKEILNLKQKEVDLEKEYQAKFLKVISARQLSELYKTEQLFNQMLVRKLRKDDGDDLRKDK